jgi:hypothetical protein
MGADVTLRRLAEICAIDDDADRRTAASALFASLTADERKEVAICLRATAGAVREMPAPVRPSSQRRG